MPKDTRATDSNQEPVGCVVLPPHHLPADWLQIMPAAHQPSGLLIISPLCAIMIARFCEACCSPSDRANLI